MHRSANFLVAAMLVIGSTAFVDDTRKTPVYRDLFPREMKGDSIDKWKAASERDDNSDLSFLAVEYKGKKYWIVYWTWRGGQGATDIAIYAPEANDTFTRCMLAHSARAHLFGAKVDPLSGLLEMRDKTNSTLNGKIILSCNLQAIGAPSE